MISAHSPRSSSVILPRCRPSWNGSPTSPIPKPTKPTASMSANSVPSPVCAGMPSSAPSRATAGRFKQTAEKFHRILNNFLFGREFHQFRASQFSTHSKPRFWEMPPAPIKSFIRSSDKNPACRKRPPFLCHRLNDGLNDRNSRVFVSFVQCHVNECLSDRGCRPLTIVNLWNFSAVYLNAPYSPRSSAALPGTCQSSAWPCRVVDRAIILLQDIVQILDRSLAAADAPKACAGIQFFRL
jgi:hypothetical protein